MKGGIIIKAKQIRAKALEKLSGNWKMPVITALLYLLISFSISFLQKTIGRGSSLSSIIGLVYFIITIPIGFGLISFFLKFVKEEEIDSFTFLKDGFNNFGLAWSVYGRTLLKMLLPIILTIVIVIAFSSTLVFGIIGQTYYSVYGRVKYSVSLTNLTGGFAIAILILFALLIACEVWLIVRQFLYIFSNMIAIEKPELTALEAVNESERLMKGNRTRYFCLSISFIGWAFLSILTFGIGFIWLIPYIQVSTVEFYKMIKEENESNKKVEDPIQINE